MLSCQGVALDILDSRARQVSLFEAYGALLTEHQRAVLDLYLARDWSLSEIATAKATSRAAVHDLIRRSLQAMEEYERRLGLVAERERRRGELAALGRQISELKRRVDGMEGRI
jgi:predicted DNA-binding protein YlxM (UPF0122 family)